MADRTAIAFTLAELGFDAYGRVVISDQAAARRMLDLFERADALSCQTGCGLPLACDTALIARGELTGMGPGLLVNNPDFATIIRKRKAVGAEEAVIAFSLYRRVEEAQAAFEPA